MITTPSSTYRLQITSDFTFDDAAAVCDYVAELGAGAIYLSPVLRSADGSTHGYDVTDPTVLDVSRGGEAGWARLVSAAQGAGLGIVLDIVPNHLGVADPRQNPTWWDVLKHGGASRYARWYDIEWSHQPIVLPVLGSAEDVAELRLVDGDAGPELGYYEHRFPVAPGTEGGTPAEVHDRQHYRLTDWRLGDAELNYRRFFAVTTLAGVEVFDDAVFDATHVRIREMVAQGQLAGIRVDHPDGLRDPGAYFDRLRALAPDAWLIGEKILEPGEAMPPWPIEGTSGYDALNEVNAILLDPAQEAAMTAVYVDLTGDEDSVAATELAGKRFAAATLFLAERRRMARSLGSDDPALGEAEVVEAFGEIAAQFEVYRSYLPAGVEHLDRALRHARAARADLAATFDALEPLLHDPTQEVARRMQQLSGAVLAKGIEDTAFYRQARFIALNEVGGAPSRFGTTPTAFHTAMRRRQRELPTAMTALSTHDTKRSEDVRARLASLAERPREWADFAGLFLARSGLTDSRFAYFLAQTLVGVGRIEQQRMLDYAEKAAREAAVHTSWTDPNEEFEASVAAAVEAAYTDDELAAAWAALEERLAPAAHSNALAAKLIQLTMPGVPDVYQGTELFDYSLVDPDNRRPVDYETRRALLSSGGSGTAGAAGAAGAAGTTGAAGAADAAKLAVVRAALRARRERPLSDYTEVEVRGEQAQHALVFDRGGLITVATRLPLGLLDAGGWGDTRLVLPEGRWRDLLTDRPVDDGALGSLLGERPVALLARDDG